MSLPLAARLGAFVVWAVVAASVVAWGLRIARPGGGASTAPAVSSAAGLAGDPLRLLGAGPGPAAELEAVAETDADRGLRLIGVVAAQPPGAGVALFEQADRPLRPVRVGQVVDGDWVLLAVERRAVQLGPRGGPVERRLSLPDPAGGVSAAAPAAGLPPRPGLPAPGFPPPPSPPQAEPGPAVSPEADVPFAPEGQADPEDPVGMARRAAAAAR